MSVWTDISGYENLLIYAKIFDVPSQDRRKIIDEALENMGLTQASHNLVSTYSGGMIRRLETASALSIKPKIMFLLGEPTIGLDPAARKVVWERLTLFKKEYGVTIFFNTHYMDEADLYSDDIAIINQGKIVAEGTSAGLKKSLGGEMLLFVFEGSSLKPGVSEKLGNMSSVKDVMVENSGLSVVVDNAESSLPHVLDTLRNEGLSPDKVSITKPTLDDVFLKYAGTRLEEMGRISDVTKTRYMIRKG
jgi:ABC-2 type transport system ATP-binding protein